MHGETFVHPSAVVGPAVTLAPGVSVGAGAVIEGLVSIGAGTKIYPYAVIGTTAQDRSTRTPLGCVQIGELCEIREFVTIHASKKSDGVTRIGNNCYVMTYSHVGHDATLEDNVTITNQVQLGGHTYLERGVTMMASAATHQFCRVGAYTAVAPFSATRQDLPPFCLFDGKPAHFVNLNIVGLRRLNIGQAALQRLRHITRLFYAKKCSLGELRQLIDRESSSDGNDQAESFVRFVEQSVRGVSRRTISDEHKILETLR